MDTKYTFCIDYVQYRLARYTHQNQHKPKHVSMLETETSLLSQLWNTAVDAYYLATFRSKQLGV